MKEQPTEQQARQEKVRILILLAAIAIVALYLSLRYGSRPLVINQVTLAASSQEDVALPGSAEASASSKKGASSRLPSAPEFSAPLEEGEEVVLTEKSVNINTAGKDELDRLPGIGPKLAERIIAYREENNGFVDIDELQDVEGIGEKTFQRLKDFIIAE